MKTNLTARAGRTLLLCSVATFAQLANVEAQFSGLSELPLLPTAESSNSLLDPVTSPLGNGLDKIRNAIDLPGANSLDLGDGGQLADGGLRDGWEVNIEPVGLNQERAAPGHGEPIPDGKHFQISVDGQTIDGSVGTAEDDQRTVDVALDRMEVHLTYDGFEFDPVANVEAQARSIEADVRERPVVFTPYWNYGSFIQRAEVRVFPADSSVAEYRRSASAKGTPLEVLPVTAGKRVDWVPSVEFSETYPEVQYVLRLYGADGQFDETRPKRLNLLHRQRSRAGNDVSSFTEESLVGYGKNSLVAQNIEVYGGAVTVAGDNVPEGSRVFVMGREVPINDKRSFVLREIVHPGSHNVTIAVMDENGQGLEFQRNLYVPDNDFFYIGLGDLTIGTNEASGPASTLFESGDDDDVYIDGRAAFFLKGKVLGKYLLTAMADTGEESIDDIFNNLDEKDPRQLLRRLDPDRHYPVYGDDSTTEELAPTQGKFYVKLKRGNSHVMWGNFRTDITGTDFAQIDRGLYGAQLKYASVQQTSFGEQRVKVTGFASEPGSASQRENFRGTGGSLYYLQHQDIQIGSEKVRVEVRDKDSGIVLNVRNLVYAEDYDIDYIQGRIILSEPLASTVDDGFLVQDEELSGNPVHLVTYYEYTPTAARFDGYFAGGRAEGWVGDFVKVGATGMVDHSGVMNRELLAGDVTLRMNAGTYIKGEYAQTSGPGYGEVGSGDGGFDFTNTNNGTGQTNSGTFSTEAVGYRVEAAADLKELGLSTIGGVATGYYQHRDAGFAAPGQYTANELDQMGGSITLKLTDSLEIRGAVDHTEDKTAATERTDANLDAIVKLSQNISAGIGAGYTATDTDERIDVGAEVRYRADDYEVYGFGQLTVEDGSSLANNDRYGVGGKFRLTENFSLGGEVSTTPDGDVGARISGDFQYSDRTTYYLAYELTDRTNTGTGTAKSGGSMAFGGKTRYTDAVSIYGEERIAHAGTSLAGITHAYGVNYAPNDRWTFDVSGEYGDVTEQSTGTSLERTALTASLGYGVEGFSVGGAAEIRLDEDTSGGERETYLARANLAYKVNPEWRLQAKVNASISDGATSIQDAKFVEGSLGFAYRPINNDRLNALFKYTGHYDLPTEVATNGTTGLQANYKQRTHILSADTLYDLNEKLTLGAKYALKVGERTTSRASNDFYKSTLHLGVLRADYHVVKNWDAVVEGRVLFEQESDTARYGALAAIYRHFGDNFKVGVGYNFSSFSDDLTNVDADAHGVFINAISKF